MKRHPSKPPGSKHAQRGGIIIRFIFLVCFVCLLFGLYLIRRPLLRAAGAFWVVDEAPISADAIVMLGDDNYNADRAARAAQLYKAGYAPRVVASGRYLRPYASVAELEEHDLTDRGVPKAAVVRFTHHAENTKDEAAALAQLISARGWKRILLVTSNYHTRRSLFLADREFPERTVVRIIAAPDSDYDPNGWWRTRAGLKIFGHECIGMVVSLWEMRHNDVQTSDASLLLGTNWLVAGSKHPVPPSVYTAFALYYISITV